MAAPTLAAVGCGPHSAVCRGVVRTPGAARPTAAGPADTWFGLGFGFGFGFGFGLG